MIGVGGMNTDQFFFFIVYKINDLKVSKKLSFVSDKWFVLYLHKDILAYICAVYFFKIY